MKGGSTRQAGKGLGNPPPKCSPQQRGSPLWCRGGAVLPQLGGAAPRPSAAPSL